MDACAVWRRACVVEATLARRCGACDLCKALLAALEVRVCCQLHIIADSFTHLAHRDTLLLTALRTLHIATHCC